MTQPFRSDYPEEDVLAPLACTTIYLIVYKREELVDGVYKDNKVTKTDLFALICILFERITA